MFEMLKEKPANMIKVVGIILFPPDIGNTNIKLETLDSEYVQYE